MNSARAKDYMGFSGTGRSWARAKASFRHASGTKQYISRAKA